MYLIWVGKEVASHSRNKALVLCKQSHVYHLKVLAPVLCLLSQWVSGTGRGQAMGQQKEALGQHKSFQQMKWGDILYAC